MQRLFVTLTLSGLFATAALYAGLGQCTGSTRTGEGRVKVPGGAKSDLNKSVHLEEPGSRLLSSSSCPSWFHEYTHFHARNRGKPHAKYLVHCVNSGAGGLGDRLNGALSMLRLAQGLDRVLLLHWAKPEPYVLENFLEPAGPVNWSVHGITYSTSVVYSFVDNDGWNDQHLHDGTLAQHTETFLTIHTNLNIDGRCWGCAPVNSSWSEEAACLWQHMFRPVRGVLEAATAELRDLYPGGLRPYVAVHLRMGGMTGEMDDVASFRSQGALANLLAGAKCASWLAGNHSIRPAQPVLVITDNHKLRLGIQERLLHNMVAPKGLPVHLDRAEAQPLEAHMRTFVDLVMLAWGHCLVTSRSGYSLHAWLYGGAKPCTMQMAACLPP